MSKKYFVLAAGTGPVIAIIIVAIIIIVVIVVAVIARSQGMLCFAGKSKPGIYSTKIFSAFSLSLTLKQNLTFKSLK